ncbi:hypothetical protein C8F04DRAFT_1253410 [Mycena alexandri]|uniref:Uncharacterized protein n=1 Tax=Mycena alexandri TaxID=1745969 RepID=A0AAD6XD49_9AGAR|nr:hypothetical protein C8F04DRAFT_1253410 [Mycena alexandri]
MSTHSNGSNGQDRESWRRPLPPHLGTPAPSGNSTFVSATAQLSETEKPASQQGDTDAPPSQQDNTELNSPAGTRSPESGLVVTMGIDKNGSPYLLETSTGMRLRLAEGVEPLNIEELVSALVMSVQNSLSFFPIIGPGRTQSNSDRAPVTSGHTITHYIRPCTTPVILQHHSSSLRSINGSPAPRPIPEYIALVQSWIAEYFLLIIHFAFITLPSWPPPASLLTPFTLRSSWLIPDPLD